MMEVIKIKKTNELNKGRKDLKKIYFSKNELSLILNIYSINVAKGVWKDYALDYSSKSALFSIFRNSYETVSLIIEKKKASNGFDFLIKNNNKVLYSSKNISKALDQIQKIPKLVKF